MNPRHGPPLDPTHYAVLGLAEDVTATELAALAGRPAPADEAARLALAVLADGRRRQVYDRYLRRERAAITRAVRRRRLMRLAAVACVLALLAALVGGLRA